MKVTVYYPTYNEKHERILRDFAAGVPGAEVKRAEDFSRDDGDIGVVFGWYKHAFAPTLAKRPIIEHYTSLGPRRLILVESAFQLRAEYFQVGWDGFAGYADFRNGDCPGDRWGQFGIKAKPWKQDGDYALVIGQLPRDTQVQDVNHLAWCGWAVQEAARVHGKALFRPHPKVQDPIDYGIDESLIQKGSLKEGLAGAKCVVTWNSTTGVDAVIAGVPVVAMDTGAMAYPMASHSIAGKLRRPSRRNWLYGLGYSQWKPSEMREGKPWIHLTR